MGYNNTARDDDMCGEKKKLTTCQVTPAKTTRKEGEQRRAASMGRPSLEALAMAGADWTKVGAGGINGEEEEGAPPPPHLRAFDAFLEDVVPVDMLLAFDREERHKERRPSPEEDVKEKLKLWAKAVARKATTTKETTRGNACKCVRCT